jgi:hypothetical protein
MANYMFIYYKQAEDDTTLSQSEIMDEWKKWFGGLGDKLVDGGGPFNDGGQAVENSGVTTIENFPATGYTIVKAGSMNEAVELAKGCPMLEHNKTTAIRVYEVMPM